MSTATVEIPTHQQVLTFVSKPRKMLIGGKWLEAASGKTFPTYNPATGEVWPTWPKATAPMLTRRHRCTERLRERPVAQAHASERGRLIWKLADLLESHLEEFAQLESLDNGKPIGVARAADVPLAVDLFRYMAGWATKIEGNTISHFSALHARCPVSRLHTARAGRRRGTDHPLELSLTHGGLEARPGVSRRLHHRPEACRADAALGPATRRADLRSGIPGRGGQHRARLRGDRRRGVGGAPGRG